MLEVVDIDTCWNDEFLQLMCLVEETKYRGSDARRVVFNFAFTIGANLKRWGMQPYYALKTLIDSLEIMKFDDTEFLKCVRQQLISGVEGLENRAWELTSNTGKPGEL